MIRGQTTKLKNEFRCLSPDCSGPLCVSVFFRTRSDLLEVRSKFSSPGKNIETVAALRTVCGRMPGTAANHRSFARFP